MADIVKFKYADKPVRGDDERRMLNLTDMWRADGADPNRDPYDWKRREGRAYIEHLARTENTAVGRIIHGERGRGGSTWAIPKIALAYGMYLSTEFQDKCLGIILNVYKDGFFVMPGREQEALASLQKTIAEQNALISNQSTLLLTQGATLQRVCEKLRELDSPDGLVKDYQAKMIRDGITVLSTRENEDGKLSKLVSWHAIDKRLRGRLKPAFPNGSWRTLPAVRFSEVMSELALMNSEADAHDRSVAREAKRRAFKSQTTIDFASRAKAAL